MRTKKGFHLRKVCNEQIIVGEGRENIDFSKIISMNESSAYLWNAIVGKEFQPNDLATLLMKEYEIDEATANKDAKAIADQWISAGIVEE